MAVNGYDVQIFLCKTLKLLSLTCITLLVNYPYVSFSLLILFILYITFPWFFWYLIYSFPVFVCSVLLILRVTSGLEKRKHEEIDPKYSTKIKPEANKTVVDNGEKSFTRVHSVRQRRAKNIDNVVEKNAVSSTNFSFDNFVDKNAVIEENPREIREVEVLDSSKKPQDSDPCCKVSSYDEVLDSSKKPEDSDPCCKSWKYEEQEEDDEKNVIDEDVGISETERNKRLESLIARRRSRKWLNLQVRRTLMKVDRNDRISTLVIPKLHGNNNVVVVNGNNGGQISPVPGSAPSVLVPMRNPFDIPYDPHEEKPDLTGDSFDQEFNISSSLQNKDMMFCRHQSFAFSPDSDLHQDNEKTYDFRFRQHESSQGYRQFVEDSEMIEPEPEPCQVPEKPGPIMDSPHDQIKEIIEISENGTQNHAEENTDQAKSTEEHLSRKSSSSSSSEEDRAFLKIDKEAILKSLSSLARRNVAENNDDPIIDYLNYPTSLFRNNRDEQFYYSNKNIQSHGPSYSIASDMQVELSEVSSPPLTIDENWSVQGDDNSAYDGDFEKRDSYNPVEGNVSSCREYETGLEDIHTHDKTVTLSIPVERSECREHLGRPPESSFSRDNVDSNGFDEILTEERTSRASDNRKTDVSDHQNSLGSYSVIPVESSITQITVGSDSDLDEVNIHRFNLDSEDPAEVTLQTTMGSDSPVSEVINPETTHSNGLSTEVSNPWGTLSSEGSSEIIHDDNVSQDLPVRPNEDVEQVTNVHSSISPKSVLLSTFSVSSFDQYIEQEIGLTHSAQDSSLIATQNSTDMVENSITVRSSDKDLHTSHESSSSRLSRMSENVEPTNELNILGSHEADTEPLELVGTSSRPFSHASNSSLSVDKEPENSSQRSLEESIDNSVSSGQDDQDVKAKGVIDETSSSGSTN